MVKKEYFKQSKVNEIYLALGFLLLGLFLKNYIRSTLIS